MKRIPAFIILMLISLISAILLAASNNITRGPIERAASAVADAARLAVLPSAERFELAPDVEGLDSLYTGLAGDAVVGRAATVTVQGFAGPIEIIVGMDAQSMITGLTVGGSNFAETAGLGSLAKEPSFTQQFVGKAPPVALGDSIDAISGATITSRAVVEGINLAAQSMSAGTPAQATTPSDASMPSTEAGVANASVMGFAGPVLVRLSVDAEGLISALEVGDQRFAETEGLGSKVKEEAFTSQFIGRRPPLTMDDIDVVSGATISTDAVVRAVNAAYAFLGE